VGDKIGAIIVADYIEHGNNKYVVTATNNNQIILWDATNYQQREKTETSDIQLCLKWSPQVQKLFTAGCDGQIHTYVFNAQNKLERERSCPKDLVVPKRFVPDSLLRKALSEVQLKQKRDAHGN
jgi:WD40 repeat protein